MALSYEREVESHRAAACLACSKAKRRCGRELPSCRRCRIRKAPCSYPARIVLSRASHPLTPPTDQSNSESSPAFADQTLLPGTVAAPAPSSPAAWSQPYSQSTPPWFLEPSSWDQTHGAIPEDDRITYPASGIDFFLDKLRGWVDQWALENHCPFIHHRLYGSDLPGPLQYALGAWNTYRSSITPTSTNIALQMARDWSQNLVEDQSISESFDNGSIDLIAHLARTQALLIFELVCLFDGDVRSRAHSEALLPTLNSWAELVMRKAKEDASADQPLDPEQLLNQPQITQLRSDGTTASSWRAYILSESIRRIWVITRLTDAAYWILKNGFCVCPGSIAFTARNGVWDASSPREWLAAFESDSTIKTIIACQRLDAVVLGAKPSDVDDLGQALLAYGRGREALDDWLCS